jgi:hypothetical protein
MKFINPFNRFVGCFVPNWLAYRKEVSQGAKLCYARLAQYAGHKGYAYPFQETLAEEIGVAERQVRRYLQELMKHKLIHQEQQGLNQPNIYYFLAHSWMEIGEEDIEIKGPVIPDRSGRPDTYDRSGRSKKTGQGGHIRPTEENHLRESCEEKKNGRAREKSKNNGNSQDEPPPPTPEQQDEAVGAVKGLLDGFLGRFGGDMPPAETDAAEIAQRKAEQIARAKKHGLLKGG